MTVYENGLIFSKTFSKYLHVKFEKDFPLMKLKKVVAKSLISEFSKSAFK